MREAWWYGKAGRWLRLVLASWQPYLRSDRGRGDVEQGSCPEPIARVDAVRLLTNAGYTPRSRAWILRIDHTEEPVLVEPPKGIAIRPFQPTRDDHAAYRVIEEAFSELSIHHPQCRS
jgi:mycothiol synthase